MNRSDKIVRTQVDTRRLSISLKSQLKLCHFLNSVVKIFLWIKNKIQIKKCNLKKELNLKKNIGPIEVK